jgi:hypothetical protein
VSYLKQDAEGSVQAVNAFHTHHSKMTWNAGMPGIDPWLRNTLVALQGTLQTMAAAQVKIAEQVDRNSERLTRIEQHLKRTQ